MESTQKIFGDESSFYEVLTAIEHAFKDSKPAQRVGKTSNIYDLGLKENSSCMVRGPHVIYGYEAFVHATIKEINWLPKEQHHIVLAELAPRDVQAATAGDGTSSKTVQRTFCLMWDEVAPLGRSLPWLDHAGLFDMLYRRVYFAPMCARIVHCQSSVAEDRIVWVPGIYDRSLRKWDTDFFGLTFVRARPHALRTDTEPDTALGLFPVAHPLSRVGTLRTHAAAHGQCLAPDLYWGGWELCEPAPAAAQALRLAEAGLPLAGGLGALPRPGHLAGPTHAFLAERQRQAREGDTQALAYLQALLPMYSAGPGSQPVGSCSRVKLEEVPVRM